MRLAVYKLLLIMCVIAPLQAIENPAALYCESMGFSYSQGTCLLPDQSRVNAWQFLRGEVKTAYSYCERKGMKTQNVKEQIGSFSTNKALCVPANKQGPQETFEMLEWMKQNGDLRSQSSKKPAAAQLPKTSSTLRSQPRAPYPSALDWRDYNGKSYIGAVRDQGGCGACYAFGAAAAAEGSYNLAHNLTDANTIDFSEAYIAFCLGEFGPYSAHFSGCQGADYDYAELTALTIEGVALESALPYSEAGMSSCNYQNYATTTFKSWGRVASNDVAGIQEALSTYGVIDVAVDATTAFENYTEGIYTDALTTCPEDENTTTNHAVSLVGWGTDPTEGVYWILRNSWDTWWGENGYMRIAAHAARVSCAATYLEAYSVSSSSTSSVASSSSSTVSSSSSSIIASSSSLSSVSSVSSSSTASSSSAGTSSSAASGTLTCPSAALYPKEIINGSEVATQDAKWKSIVALLRPDFDPFYDQFCGGTLIDPSWVLTAAHCIYNAGSVTLPASLRIGSHDYNLSTMSAVHTVTRIIMHPSYDEASKDNDIALIELDTPITDITPMILTHSNPLTPDTCTMVAGWGNMSQSGTPSWPEDLMEVGVPLVSSQTCSSIYSTTSNMICAGYLNGQYDSCQGDSGGPLIISENGVLKQVGIVSFGEGCALAGYPGVYTKVQNYIGWIENYVNLSNQSVNPSILMYLLQ